MARIISQIDKNTGRRVKVASLEGDGFKERNASLADTLGVSKNKASKLSNNETAKALAPGFSSLTPPAVSSATLANEPDFNLPTGINSATGSAMSLDATLAALPKTLAQNKKDAQTNEQDSFEAFLSGVEGAETPSQVRLRTEKDLGIQALDTNATDLSNQLIAEQERLRKEVERVQTAPGSATASERDREVAELTRVSRRQQADLSITQLAAQGRLDAARRIADTAVLAETEYQQKKLDILQLAYNRNKDLFTKAEQREFEMAQADRERIAENETFKLRADYEQKIRQNDPLYLAQLAKARADAAAAAGSTSPENVAGQLAFLQDAVKGAKDLASQSGQGNLTKAFGDLVGGSKYRQLEAYTNTLRTNVLTLATDPGVKKYFGPQMSEADVRLMTAAGTTLNPENQSPAQLAEELTRLESLFNRMQNSIPNGAAAASGATAPTSKFITAPDGTVVEIVD